MATLSSKNTTTAPAGSNPSSWKLFWLRLPMTRTLHLRRSKQVQKTPLPQAIEKRNKSGIAIKIMTFPRRPNDTTKDDKDSSWSDHTAPFAQVRDGTTIVYLDESKDEDNGDSPFSILTMDPALTIIPGNSTWPEPFNKNATSLLPIPEERPMPDVAGLLMFEM